MRTAIAIFILFSLHSAYGQQNYDPEVIKYFNEGVNYYHSGEYHEANISFRNALATNKVLPTNLSYYFAETLYHIRQYQNSKNFVDKYLSLAGYGGDFYEEAAHLHELIEGEFLEIKECKRCNVFGYRYIPCEQCDSSGIEVLECPKCKGKGNTLCPKCTGRGVVITRTVLDQDHYETCDKCEGDGVIVCERCLGDKEITRVCFSCLGTKLKASNILCNHEAEQNELFEKKNFDFF